MVATNEKLLSSNDDVIQAHNELTDLNKILLANEALLKFTVDAADLGTWDLDPKKMKFTGNNRLKSWFGLLPDEEIQLNLATNNIAEGDRSRVAKAIEVALDYNSGGIYDITYTITNPDDKIDRFVRAKAGLNSTIN